MICVSLEDTKHLEAADTVINGGQFAIICRPNVGDEEGQIENYKTNLNWNETDSTWAIWTFLRKLGSTWQSLIVLWLEVIFIFQQCGCYNLAPFQKWYPILSLVMANTIIMLIFKFGHYLRAWDSERREDGAVHVDFFKWFWWWWVTQVVAKRPVTTFNSFYQFFSFSADTEVPFGGTFICFVLFFCFYFFKSYGI